MRLWVQVRGGVMVWGRVRVLHCERRVNGIVITALVLPKTSRVLLVLL